MVDFAEPVVYFFILIKGFIYNFTGFIIDTLMFPVKNGE